MSPSRLPLPLSCFSLCQKGNPQNPKPFPSISRERQSEQRLAVAVQQQRRSATFSPVSVTSRPSPIAPRSETSDTLDPRRSAAQPFPRSETLVEVQEIAAKMGQSNPDTPVDMNKIYLDVLGGGLDKKQRLFGTGSLASTLKTNISGESSTSAMSDIDKEQYATRLGDVEEQLQAERERTSRLEEQVKVAMEIIKQLQGQSSSATSHPNPSSNVP